MLGSESFANRKGIKRGFQGVKQYCVNLDYLGPVKSSWKMILVAASAKYLPKTRTRIGRTS